MLFVRAPKVRQQRSGDGEGNAFTEWLRRRDVRIFKHESFLRAELLALGERRETPMFPAIARGAFLRVELPRIAAAQGISGRVLYTDCDVFFRGDM